MNPYRGDGADPQQPRLSTLRKLDHSHSTDRPHSPANRSASRFAAPGSLWFVWIALLMSIGASIAGYMAYVGLTGSRVAGCGGGIFSCDHVVTSRFSTVLWIPVGVPACMLYIVGLGFVLRAAATHADARHLCVRAIGWIGGLASASGLWFVGLQIFYLEHLCSYCMAAHGTAAILLASYCIRIRPTRTRVGVASFWCTSSAILLATVQLLTPPPPTFEIQTDPVVVDIPLPMGMEFDPASTAPATDPADVFGAPGQSDGGMFEAPASQDAAPLFDAPATTAPTFDAPTFDAPKVDASTLNAPTSDAAKRDASVVETTISETTSSAIAALQSVPGPEAKSDASNPNAAALKADPLNVGALDKSAAMLGALTESTSDDSPAAPAIATELAVQESAVQESAVQELPAPVRAAELPAPIIGSESVGGQKSSGTQKSTGVQKSVVEPTPLVFPAPVNRDGPILFPAPLSTSFVPPLGTSIGRRQAGGLNASPPWLSLLQPIAFIAAPVDDDASSKTADDDASSKTADDDAAGKTADDDAAGKAEDDAAGDGAVADQANRNANNAAKVAAAPAPAPDRMVPVSGGRRQLKLGDWPMLGSVDDKFVLVKMFDYTCGHCRKTNKAIREARKQTPGGLAVVTLPIPLYQGCNPGSQTTDPKYAFRCDIAKLAVAVWLADAKQFETFHEWMMAQERSLPEARAKADELVGAKAIETQMGRSTPGDFVSRHVFLYRESGAGTLPKLVFSNNSVLVGELTDGNFLSKKVTEAAR